MVSLIDAPINRVPCNQAPMHREFSRISRQGDRRRNQDRCLAVERAVSALLLLACRLSE